MPYCLIDVKFTLSENKLINICEKYRLSEILTVIFLINFAIKYVYTNNFSISTYFCTYGHVIYIYIGFIPRLANGSTCGKIRGQNKLFIHLTI